MRLFFIIEHDMHLYFAQRIMKRDEFMLKVMLAAIINDTIAAQIEIRAIQAFESDSTNGVAAEIAVRRMKWELFIIP